MLKAKMIDKAMLCIKDQRIADWFVFNQFVLALHVCICQQTINNLSGINVISQ